MKTTNLQSNLFLFSTPNNSWKCGWLVPGLPQALGVLISVLNRPHWSLSLQGSNRIAHGFREFILTECRFSFEHAQLISQKASFCLSPFGIKIRKESRSGNKTKHSRSLSNQPFWIFSNSALSDELYLNKCTDGGIKLWFAVKWWLRHWFASCCNGIIEQVSKQTPLLYIRDRFSACSYSYSQPVFSFFWDPVGQEYVMKIICNSNIKCSVRMEQLD